MTLNPSTSTRIQESYKVVRSLVLALYQLRCSPLPTRGASFNPSLKKMHFSTTFAVTVIIASAIAGAAPIPGRIELGVRQVHPQLVGLPDILVKLPSLILFTRNGCLVAVQSLRREADLFLLPFDILPVLMGAMLALTALSIGCSRRLWAQ